MSAPLQKTPKEFLEDYRVDQIVTAALAVIAERGFNEAKVDEIARCAGLSRTTVYQYFANKQEILLACIAQGREEMFDLLRHRVGEVQGLGPQLQAFVEVAFGRVDRRRNVFRAIQDLESLSQAIEGPGGSALADLIGDFRSSLGAILSAAREAGELGGDVEPAANGLSHLIMGALTNRTLSSSPPPADEAARDLVRFAMRGIASAGAPLP